MRTVLACLLLTLVLPACSSPITLTSAKGFTFADFDRVYISKSDESANSSLYGMDVQLANVLGRYGLAVIGDKENAAQSMEAQRRTLFARMAVTSGSNRITVTVAFDEAATGRTVSSITVSSSGSLIDPDDRAKAFEAVSIPIIRALQKDKPAS